MLRTPDTGDAAPEFNLKSMDGTTYALADLLEGRNALLLIFMRYLG